MARRAEPALDDAAPQPVDEQGTDLTRLPEANLRLGRVHVDVDAVGRHVQPQHHHRMTVGGEHGTVGGAYHPAQLPVADRAAVDEQELAQAVGAVIGRQARPTVQHQTVAFAPDFPAVGGEVGAHDVAHAVAGVAAPGQGESAPGIVLHVETHRRVRQREAANNIEAGAGLGLLALEKLEPGRNGVEQVADLDHCTGIGGGRAVEHGLAALHPQRPAVVTTGGAGGQAEARHRGDRWQGLSPETELFDADQISLGQLRGCMPFQRQPHAFGVHAVAVVFDPDQRLAAFAQQDRDPLGPGVDGVLHQLLDHARRAVHDLARRDLIDQRVGQAADRRQGRVRGSLVGFRRHDRTLAL